MSPAKGLNIDFSNYSNSGTGNGFYNERDNLIGMLEAKEYRALDMVSPFIGMITDRCCGENSTAVITSIFVQYVDIILISLSYDGNDKWTEPKVKCLERMIRRFKESVVETFGDYQASSFCTEKFHLLDHICSDIRRAGGLRFGDARLYEYTHTKVKNSYRSGSKRRKGAMDETLQSFMKESSFHQKESLIPSKTSNLNKSRAEPCSVLSEAMKCDCAVLVKKGKVFKLSDLKAGRELYRRHRKAQEDEDSEGVSKYKSLLSDMDKNVSELLDDIGECGCRVLHSLLKEKCYDVLQSNKYEYCKITRVASAFVPGISTPTAEDYNRGGDRIRLRPSPRRNPQRVVSCRGFYSSSVLRQDCVLLESEEEKGSATSSIWVAKALAFIRLESNYNRTNEQDGNELDNNAGEETEYVFLQYFDIAPLYDTIDKVLGCVRLRWARHESQTQANSNEEHSSRWYDLVPAAAIRGSVHVVRGDYGINGRGVIASTMTPSYDQHFYINRFYYDPDHRYYEYEKEQRLKLPTSREALPDIVISKCNNGIYSKIY